MKKEIILDITFLFISTTSLIAFTKIMEDYEWTHSVEAWLLLILVAISIGKFLFDIAREENDYGKH